MNLIVRSYTKEGDYLLIQAVDRSIPNEFEHGEPFVDIIKHPGIDFELLPKSKQLEFLTDQINN